MTPDTQGPNPRQLVRPPARRSVFLEPPVDPDLLFLQSLQRRRIPFTYVFIGFNFLVFLVMEIAGGTTNPATLVAFGAKSNAEIASGEIWRFLTPVFIHIGILHLAFNSYALWIVGQQVERLYGSARFVTLYVLMGIAGVAGSYFFNPDSLSAGASGAIFGLFGVLLMFGIRNRGRAPAFLRRAIGAGILPLILLNLAIGMAIPAIDNAAHVAGLLAGMTLATIIGFRPPGAPTGRIARTAQLISLVMILAAFQQVAAHYESPGRIDRFVDAVNEARLSFDSAERAVREDAPDWSAQSEALGRAIDALGDAPSLTAASDAILQDLERSLEEQYALIEDIRRTGRTDARHLRRLAPNAAAFREAYRDLSDWVEDEGAEYGLQLVEGPTG